MRMLAHITLAACMAFATGAQANPAITAFTTYCMKAGQTVADARANMEGLVGAPLPFTLTFWDDSLEPRPADAPDGVERRCEVAFDGKDVANAVKALQTKMATPPVFGTPIPLPQTHLAEDGTALIQGRELLRGRVAVVHVGTRNDGATTFIAVDRLYDGLGLPKGDG